MSRLSQTIARRATADGLCDPCFVLATAEIATVIDARRGGDEWMTRDE
jgi:hypothetical protein